MPIKKTYSLLFTLMLCSFNLSAQLELSETARMHEMLDSIRVNLRTTKSSNLYTKVNKAITFAEETNNDSLLFICYRTLQAMYSIESQYFKAIDYGYRAYEIAKANNYTHGAAQMLNNLSWTLIQCYDNSRAILLLKEALDILDEQPQAKRYKLTKIFVANCAAIAYTNLNLPDSALVYNNLAAKANIEINNTQIESWILAQFGEIYEKLGELEKAENYYVGSITHSDSTNNYEAAIYAIEKYCHFLNKEDRFDESISYGEKGFDLAKQHKARKYLIEISEHLRVSYELKNNLDSAYYYSVSSSNYRDSVFNEKKNIQVQNLIFSQEIKEKELLHLKEVNSRIQQRNIVLGLGSFILLLAAGLWSRLKYVRKTSTLIQAQSLRLIELDAVKTRMYTNITHEFRTPLTVISGMASQIKEDPKAWFGYGLTMIQRNANRLLELVNQMLDLTKLESGIIALNNQQGDILIYLKYLVESIHSFAESKKIQVHFHEEGEELMMDFDPEKIQQIMINLLSNAVKFTPAEGHIYVHVRAVAEKDSPQKGSKLQIKVKNTGPGIPEDQLPYIFDRFYQVDDSTTRAGEGSGIGLALVKELVKLMKGDISVKSKVGKETEFTLLLPISNEAAEGQIPVPSFKYETVGLVGESYNNLPTNLEKEASEIILEAVKPRVLLVEDNPDVVAYTASCLQGLYEIQVGKDGQEGIDIAIENIPDIIITDVMMPHKDGFEVCQTLKIDQRTSHIPIIMLTAKADMESKIEGLEKGADAYLAKPFDKRELLVRIKKLFELRANLQKHYLSIVGSNGQENNGLTTGETPAEEDKFILRLREVVEAHMEDFDYSVEKFCKEVAMSHSQLHRKLTALTGLSPNKFIRHVRLSKAKLLLQDSALTVSAVAYETGFNDPSYFGRVFKKEFGMTPVEWKEREKP